MICSSSYIARWRLLVRQPLLRLMLHLIWTQTSQLQEQKNQTNPTASTGMPSEVRPTWAVGGNHQPALACIKCCASCSFSVSLLQVNLFALNGANAGR